MRLPKTVQEIADVIGRDKALFLIGQLPRCIIPARPPRGPESRVILYVPTIGRLKPDHNLVAILGWNDAAKLCRHFGGEILNPGTCREIYQRFREVSIARMLREGTPARLVSEWMGVSERHVRNMAREIAHKEVQAAANDNAEPMPNLVARL